MAPRSRAVMDDVRKAFMLTQFPSMQPQMMAIIEYAFRIAEESTSIPLVTQGQSGDTTPDTFGGMQLQNNNANQLLRAVGYQVDDCITSRWLKPSTNGCCLIQMSRTTRRAIFRLTRIALVFDRAVDSGSIPSADGPTHDESGVRHFA